MSDLFPTVGAPISTNPQHHNAGGLVLAPRPMTQKASIRQSYLLFRALRCLFTLSRSLQKPLFRFHAHQVDTKTTFDSINKRHLVLADWIMDWIPDSIEVIWLLRRKTGGQFIFTAFQKLFNFK